VQPPARSGSDDARSFDHGRLDRHAICERLKLDRPSLVSSISA
jgi:hypothetical protein